MIPCFLLALLLTVGTLHAQSPPDSTTTLLSFAGEWTNKDAWGGRLFVSGGPDFIQISPFSWSFVRDPADGRVKLSVNPLLSVGSGLLLLGGGGVHNRGPWPLTVLGVALAVPQVLPNLTLQLPVVPRHIYLAAGQRTDYYLFNSVAHVYTEGYVGARLMGGEDLPLSAEVRYVWPATKGFLENRKPYIGVAVSVAMVKRTR